MVSVSVLGPLEVRNNSDLVDVGSPRHREVLAALVVDVGRVVSTEALLDRVWGDGARGAAPANLHAVISRLRGRLRVDTGTVTITTVAPGYRLDAPATAVDAALFQSRLDRSHSVRAAGDFPAARELVGDALDLWRGTAYADVHRPFAEAEAARLDGQRLAAHELAADLDLAMGRHSTLVDPLTSLVTEHPLREALRAQLMVALYRCGRQVEALALYDEAREVLADELGLDPGPDLQALHQRILRHDEDLRVPAPTPAGPEPGSARMPGTAPDHPNGRLRSAAVRGPVPALSLDGLLGRDREVDYVRALVEESAQRLVTLTGVGGVGKTRLAYAVAAAARPTFDDGVAFVELAELTDPVMVVPAIGRAVGLAAVEGLDPVAAVADHLRRLRVLVVLDNAEHVIDAARHVAALVAACPGLSVLATSRAPLRVRGESQYQVQPLSLPEEGQVVPDAVVVSAAVALFVERARMVMPGFAVEPGNAAAVGTICRRLAGIPLALELAAAKVRLLPPGEILARLDDVMAGAGARDLPPRQRTMRAALDWSYRLLGSDEQRFFRRLSVFSGGFTIEAAEAVTGGGDGAGVLTLLDSLVEHSLVVPDAEDTPEPRFRMLEPVLQYARSQLAGPEAADARAAHLRFFLDLAEATEPMYRSEGTVEALALTQREHGNMVAAVEAALADGRADLAGRLGWALWLFWWLRGRLLEGRRLMEAILAEELPDDVRVRATAVLGAMTFAQGDLDAARCWADGAALAAATGDVEGESHSVAGVGLIALAEGDLAAAESAFRATIPLCERTGDAGGWLWTLAHVWLATVCLLRDAPQEAAPLLEVALAAGRSRNDRLAVYIALFTASQVALRVGDADRAREQLVEGVLLSQETGDMANLAYFLDALAVVESLAGGAERVAVLLGAAQRLRETVGANVYGYYKPDEALRTEAAGRAESSLGAERYADAVAAGRRMSMRDIVGFAVTAPAERGQPAGDLPSQQGAASE